MWVVAVLVSVAVTFLCFPPFPLGPALLVGLVPLFWALDRAPTWKAAFFRAWIYVFVGNAAICIWVAAAVRDFGHVPWVLGLAAVLAVSAFEHIAWPIAAALRHWIRGRSGGRIPLYWTPAVIVSLDAFLPKLFPDTVGNGLYSVAWLAQSADLVGTWGLTGLVAATNEAVAMHFSPAPSQEKRRHAFAAAALLVFFTGYGAARWYWVQGVKASPAATIRMGLVQPNVNTFVKVRAQTDRGRARRDVFELLWRMTESAAERAPDVIFWPETTFPTGYLPPGDPARATDVDQALLTAELETRVKRLKIPLLFGTPIHDRGHRYNGLVLLSPKGDGVESQDYRKLRLLLLGEYAPLESWFPGFWKRVRSGGTAAYEAGSEAVVFPTAKAVLGPMICLEGLDAILVRDLVLRGAQVLVNATNDAWFGAGTEPALHLQLTAFRAIELRRPLVRATNTGYSAVIDIDGTLARPEKDA